MSSLVLTYKSGRSPALTDGSALRPDILCRLSREALAAMPLRIGRTCHPLSEVFTIGTTNTGDNWLFICCSHALDRLGAGMTGGVLVVDCAAGDDLGASMSGGIIRVNGNAGHRVGGPDITSKRGMTGGEIVINGNAGDHAGFLMRRGLIAIEGSAGKSPGYRMLAGTVVVGRGPLHHPGLEMQRGTIVCLDDPALARSTSAPIVAATAMPSLLLLARRLDQLRWGGDHTPITARIAAGSWRITHMAPFALNKGEVLQWQA